MYRSSAASCMLFAFYVFELDYGTIGKVVRETVEDEEDKSLEMANPRGQI